MAEQLTLYTAKICPYAHRVELALHEAQADFKSYQIDLKNKPEWYAPKVNPASKVPAIAYGGPATAPESPSEESQKIAESLVLLEFVADLYPNSSLLPKDPVARAKVRFFIDTVVNKFVPSFAGSVIRGESPEGILKGVEAIQDLLPSTGYAIGPEFTIADAAVAPFAARIDVCLKNDIGSFKPGEGKKVYEVLQSDPKYERFREYFRDIQGRPSFKATFDEEYVTGVFIERFSATRATASVGA